MLEKGNKKIINAWAFYDWANSVYPLVITTAIFPIFYESQTNKPTNRVEFLGGDFKNTELYSYVIVASFIIVSILSPILSGIADYSGNKKSFLKFFCYLGAASVASLYFFDKEHLELSMLSIMLASVGFWGSLVFYNAYLPEIAEPEHHDRVSAKGFSLGYFGSALLLIINLAFITNFEAFGFEDKGLPTRIAFLSVAVWWVGFSQITYRRLPNNVYERKPGKDKFTKGFQELRNVWKVVSRTVRLKRYLLAFFTYSMGVQTVMLMATLYASNELEMEPGGLITSILLIQFVAIGGAYLFSAVSKKIGNLRSLEIQVLIWVGICIGAYFITTETQFYIVAGVVGLVMGGIQSLSRSTYAKFLPETKDHASFFSFYDVTEKVAIVIGMFAFGYIDGLFDSMKNSIFALGAFFVIGFVLLLLVPKSERSNTD